MHISLKEIGISSEEIPISVGEICISLPEIHISFFHLSQGSSSEPPPSVPLFLSGGRL